MLPPWYNLLIVTALASSSSSFTLGKSPTVQKRKSSGKMQKQKTKKNQKKQDNKIHFWSRTDVHLKPLLWKTDWNSLLSLFGGNMGLMFFFASLRILPLSLNVNLEKREVTSPSMVPNSCTHLEILLLPS